MPWYKSGTVSVVLNSNAVIGTGTAFIANSRVGDAFRGPDGGWYEVTNIASDTALSISPNYQGATNAAGVYALAPMQGYVKDSADQLRSLVNLYGAKMAALGTTGNYDILPVTKGGTGITDLSAFIQGMLNDADAPAARTTLGAAKSGANSDITSLAGMTSALSASQGGTGNTTGTATKLAAAAMVGTASQAGGVPTGAIIEKGSNANGQWTKWADGTMITQFRLGASFNITNAFGSLFYANIGSISYPQTFVDVPSCSITSAGYGWISRTVGSISGTGSSIIVNPLSVSGAVTVLEIIAVGRWY